MTPKIDIAQSKAADLTDAKASLFRDGCGKPNVRRTDGLQLPCSAPPRCEIEPNVRNLVPVLVPVQSAKRCASVQDSAERFLDTRY